MSFRLLARRLHISWLIAALCAAASLGVMLAQQPWAQLFVGISWLLAGLGLAAIGIWRGRVYALIFVVVAGAMIGLWRGGMVQADLLPYSQLYGYEVTVAGKVVDDPDIDKKNALNLRLAVATVDGRPLPNGTLWVTTPKPPEPIKRSDIVTIHGTLLAGFGTFAGTMYRADVAKVERPVPGDVAGQARDWFGAAVRRVVDDPQAALGIGFITGQRQALPSDLDEALKLAGLTHIVVASGYNLTILVRLARRLFVKVSKYLSAVAAGSMIIGFVAVTGLSPSMSRAGLVAGLSLLAWYYGRKFHPLVLLPFAAAVTLLVNPHFGWGDLGWQLSFAAFAGVMVLAPLMQAYFFGNKQPGTIRQILGETIAAQIATLPILVVAFGQFSNVALITNLLIVPLVPTAMLLTFVAGIMALLLPPVASLFGWLAHSLLTYMTSVAQYFAALPWVQTELTVPWQVGLLAYAVMIAACFYLQRATRYDLRDANLVE